MDPQASTSSSTQPTRPQMIFGKNLSRNSSKNDSSNKDGVGSFLGKKNSSKEKLKNSSDVADYCSDFAAHSAAEKNRQELSALREQLEDISHKVLDKDEFVKATDVTRNQMNYIQTQVDELKRYATEKDTLINDAKKKLANKQMKLEKLQWEAKASKQKVEGLEEELDSMQSHISALMTIFEGLSNNDSVTPTGDFEFTPFSIECLPDLEDDDDNMNEVEMYKMEEARKDYVAAVAVAKERRDEASLAAAARARLRLQSFVFTDNDDDY